MISKDVLKRIEALEQAVKSIKAPSIVFAIQDDQTGKYIISESYSNPYRVNRIEVDSMEEYNLPEGFKGVMFCGEEDIKK